MKNQVRENDDVFILRGKDEEMYLVDDPEVIARLDKKIRELQGMADTEIIKHLLQIVNPQKYPAHG
jgi:hypothetical protein